MVRIYRLSIVPVLILFVSLTFIAEKSLSNTEFILIGKYIPTLLKTGSHFIFSKSDSLYLNDKLLQRGVDYKFVPGEGYFDLSQIPKKETDTLLIKYKPVPAWMPISLGRDLPVASEVSLTKDSKDLPKLPIYSSVRSENISLSGIKTFRFASRRSGGGNEFGQTLDLSISGELSPGLEITGSVSDRGFDPTYGTANSRINELDRLKLMLRSKNMKAQIGDLLLENERVGSSLKPVSGLAVELNYNNWFAKTIVARPRGQYATIHINGQDRFQGPYQLTSGSNAGPVVPGSERVWLDGQVMRRGAEKDYSIDYPVGRITFSVDNPIDSRSRIEVDFEPQATEYKQELLATSGGISVKDSLLSISLSILREGDDINQPLGGELGQLDKDILILSGDSVAYKSGVILDSLGSYKIDSTYLPDTVYIWAGEKLGDRRITFIFLGQGKGDYNFVGGEQYLFVGKNLGGYMPLVLLPTAVRADLYKGMLITDIPLAGKFTFDLRTTSYDKNLFSTIDDNDNEAHFYRLQWTKFFEKAIRDNYINITHQLTELSYRSRDRLRVADFDRHYYLPEGYVRAADERFSEYSGKLSPYRWLQLSPFYGKLAYKDQFNSESGKILGEIIPSDKSGLKINWSSIKSELIDTLIAKNGKVNNLGIVAYKLLGNKSNGWRISVDYENDNRRNNYKSEKRGTRYEELELSILHGNRSSAHDNIQLQIRREDSLQLIWHESVKRNRLIAVSGRQLGNLAYDASLTYQWLKTITGDNNSLLGRLSLQYSNSKRNLQVRTAYTISEERRNSRGISYLEVEDGMGRFIFEDSQYIPDPAGNFIKVEEILSNAQEVRRASKSFYLSKRWSEMSFNFSSDIEEELKIDGKRRSAWFLPFYSDHKQPYLFYMRRYRVDTRFIKYRGFYLINLSGSEEREIREISSIPRARYGVKGKLTLKQAVKESYFEEQLSLFKSERDSYYSGSGVINGFESILKYKQTIKAGELSVSARYRKAKSNLDEKSQLIASEFKSRIKLPKRGEWRFSIEIYKQNLNSNTGLTSYQLTGNRPGTKGSVWSTNFIYRVKSSLRISFSLEGRHSDIKTARISMHSELVAEI